MTNSSRNCWAGHENLSMIPFLQRFYFVVKKNIFEKDIKMNYLTFSIIFLLNVASNALNDIKSIFTKKQCRIKNVGA